MTSHEVKVIWKEKWSGNWQEIYIDKLKHKYTGWKQKNKIPKWKKNENCPKFTKLKWELKTFGEITVSLWQWPIWYDPTDIKVILSYEVYNYMYIETSVA